MSVLVWLQELEWGWQCPKELPILLACVLVCGDLGSPGKYSVQEAPLTQDHGTPGCKPGHLECSVDVGNETGGVVLAEMSL